MEGFSGGIFLDKSNNRRTAPRAFLPRKIWIVERAAEDSDWQSGRAFLAISDRMKSMEKKPKKTDGRIIFWAMIVMILAILAAIFLPSLHQVRL